MTTYELKRTLTFPIMPALILRVRKDLCRLLNSEAKNPLSILDVGGRKSPYTIGLPVEVTLLDIPQETEAQQRLNLGLTDRILASLKKTRSNVRNVLLQDMTKTTLPAASFDAVVCVEVIEHVIDDESFVKNISHVIRSGGWAYFTTPNGDYIKNEPPNYNPDHQRHYTREQLKALLERYFDTVEVRYAIKTGRFRRWGMPGYTVRRPFKTLRAIFGNIINGIQSRALDGKSVGTAHLIAVGYKVAKHG